MVLLTSSIYRNMTFIGSKDDIDLYENLIKDHIPSNIQEYTYIEPFGGSFGLRNLFQRQPKKLIYNDIIKYDFEISNLDERLDLDYKEILDRYDSSDSLFYLDPPYYGKEHFYGMNKNDKKFHTEIRSSIENRLGLILLSYQDCPFIRELYEGFEIYQYKGTHKYKLKEILIKI